MSENSNFEAPMAQAGHTSGSSRGSSPDNDYLDVPGQRALPTTPARGRDATNRATPPSKRSDSEDDVSMNDIAMSTRGSSASGTTTPGGRKRAKKQPQRFCCTQFAPCSLTFTRSEHLARHIRKHTGERPFQCHCGRRFSRLDNLRQHSQTVHANEEIPADSLANTGGRGPYARDRKAILSRQSARPMQPLQQQHFQQGPPSGRHIGHRRNVHSMPVNQMAPMYGNYHEPRGAPAPSQMMDPRGPAFTYGQPLNRYYSPEPYQSPAAYNTPPSNRSSGNFGEYYQEPNHHAGFSFPIRNDANYGAPLRRQSISSATGPYFDMPMRGSMSGPQLPPLHSGIRESFHHQSANIFEQSPVSTAPSEHSQYSPYARREESYHPMSEDPRRRTWHAGSYQRETYQLSQLSGGMHSMNITPPEEARDRAYNYATRDNDSVHLPPIRTLEETPLSPYRREPSPYQMEMRATEAPAQSQDQVNQVDPSLRSETERSAADALASMGRRID